MDVRARLMLAFVPLLLVLIGLGMALVYYSAQITAAIELRRQLTTDLLETQEIAIAIFQEHDIAVHIAAGEHPADDPAYAEARERTKELIEAEAGEPRTAIDDDSAIAAQYAILAAAHDEAVAAARAGDLAGASEAFERPGVDEALELIIAESAEMRVGTQEILAQGDRELQTMIAQARGGVTFGLLLGIAAAFGLAWLLIQQVVGPLNRLTADAERLGVGDLAGELSPAGNIAQVRRLRDSFQRLIDANRERQGQIQVALDELKQRVEREKHLRETVAALSIPVVPLSEDKLLLPLVGHLDEQRANELTSSLLNAIQKHRVRNVVLDLTGLAELDGTTAERLRQTAAAARLLGCKVILAGLRAEQAIALSGLDLAGSGITFARDIAVVLRDGNGP